MRGLESNLGKYEITSAQDTGVGGGVSRLVSNAQSRILIISGGTHQTSFLFGALKAETPMEWTSQGFITNPPRR